MALSADQLTAMLNWEQPWQAPVLFTEVDEDGLKALMWEIPGQTWASPVDQETGPYRPTFRPRRR